MSVKDASKLYKTPGHERRESDELDVFEAAGYFSGYSEAAAPEYNNNGATHNTQKPTTRESSISENQYYHNKKMNWRSSRGRMSLDVPFRDPMPIPQQQQANSGILDKQFLKENNNKYKQPSSPGGRLASFLNSLFNQAGSKKNKKKSTKDVCDEESPPGGGWRRRRRSSISHFRSSSSAGTTNTNTNTNVIITTETTSDPKSLMSNFSSGNCNSISGFRTPPPYAPTPTKSYYKEFRSFSDHHHHHLLKQVTTGNNNNNNNNNSNNYSSLGNKPPPLMDHHQVKVKNSLLGDHVKSDEAVLDVDDGAESDSSSDLFELQNYDLGLDVYSTGGLPVYETTRMDSIKRGAPVIS